MIVLPTTAVLVLFLLIPRLNVECCPSTGGAVTKPLYLLTLVPFPQDNGGWDKGLGVIAGSRVARDEINNRTDLLPGYHIELIVENIEACSRTEAGIGLSNLVRYTVDPPCRPVVAVIGLVCSSHTAALSPVAGHNGFDLIQLSVANSPLFKTSSSSFSHLWRFLGSDTNYADTALALMDQFGWSTIGLVYNVGSAFHLETAQYFSRQIKESNNKTIAFDIAVSGTNPLYFEQVLFKLRNSEETIMLVSLNAHQVCLLLNQTLNEGVVYPDYTWILVETKVDSLISANVLDPTIIYNASRGHIHLFAQTHPENKSLTLPSGDTIASLDTKYELEFNEVMKGYSSRYNVTRYMPFESYLYDQVWALSLALNKSLPLLANRNLSIDNYTIGQHEITDVIEQQLANLSYQGASGWVEFNEHRTISTPIEIFWILENGVEQHVGLYNPLIPSGFLVNISTSQLPRDTLPRMYHLIYRPVAILLYMLIAALIIFTTVQLILYLLYRDHKVIKATSPYLSLLMFAGCYLLCVAGTLKTTRSTFVIPEKDFLILLSTDFIIVLNGFSLILITLFIKLLRIYRIFSSKLSKDLGKYWSNFPLLLTIIFLTALPNTIVLPIILHPFQYKTNKVYKETFTKVHIDIKSPNFFLAVSLIAGYIALFSCVILYLVIITCNIRHKNFNDTKKLNIFNFILFFTTALVAPLYIILLLRDDEATANIVLVVGCIIISGASQFILFLPKVLPTVLSSVYPKWETLYSSILSHIYPTTE